MDQFNLSGNLITCTWQFPLAPLNGFIESYTFREIIVKEGSSLSKYMPCRHYNSIDFYLGDNYETIDLETGNLIPFWRCTIRGPRTYKKYQITLKGIFKSFSIKFKPTGIYQMLGIPMDNFLDESIDACLIQSGLFDKLTEQLYGCNDVQSCIAIVEPILIKLLADYNKRQSVSAKLADLILTENDSSSLNIYYRQLPLSSRQIERNFTKEVGVTPKAFSSMVRFEKMIRQRIQQPESKWTEMAYQYNYFDQMHLIKDFQKYLGINPGSFSHHDFAF